ncbi:LysR family transcriptional regulator [Pseudomonas sp. RIT-To-2]|uniref:LysR family transcriptional regulator n=1 Tax=Pseudomonas sp. RIT-To-2 TaxID=3462541 RepID=UPI00241308CE
MNRFSGMDLNLLLTLQALLAERHITRAAQRLHKSQPAISHALRHLRHLFGDPLLVRRGRHLDLTPRAAALIAPLNEVLSRISQLLDAPQFDPAKSQRAFRLVMSDYGSRVLLPGLVERCRARAPGVELLVQHGSRNAMLAAVQDGDADLALGVFPGRLAEVVQRSPLFVERFVCLADASTCVGHEGLTLSQWLARPHIVVGGRAVQESEVDQALARLGLQRNVKVTLPHWNVASELVVATDLILTVAMRSLTPVHGDSRLCIFEPPFDIPCFDFSMVAHRRSDNDPAHAWMRQLVMEVASAPC